MGILISIIQGLHHEKIGMSNKLNKLELLGPLLALF